MTDKTKPRTTVAQDVAALRAIADGAHAAPETPAEVLAIHELPAMFRRAADGVRTSQAAVYEYCAAQLERSLAAGKVVAWLHEDGDRVIHARTKAISVRDGGASSSSVAKYSVPLYTAPPADPAKASGSAPDGWLLELREAMAHCVSAADEGEDYAVSREMLNVMTTLGLMQKVGRGKWAPTDAGMEFAAQRGAKTLPIDISGRWYEVPIPVQLHIVSMRDQLSGATATPPASAPEVTEEMVGSLRLAVEACNQPCFTDKAEREISWAAVSWMQSHGPALVAALTAALQQEGKSHDQ